MQRHLFAIISVVMLMAVHVVWVSAAYADVNDFVVTSFSADDRLTRENKQGTLHITEHIAVHYTNNNHGLLRSLPESYKGRPLKVTIEHVSSSSGAPSSYTTSHSNGNVVLKIGSSSQTVTGDQSYDIAYTVQHVIGFYPDHAELYWDINGTDWQQSFGTVAVTLHLPVDLKQVEALSARCYTGGFGATASKCTVTVTPEIIDAITTTPLTANQSLTLVAGFATGYFTPATWRDRLADHARDIALAGVPPLIIGGLAAGLWFRRGRDPKGRGTIVPAYDAPDGLKPLAVGTISDFKVDNRDITATIIDLAVRRYIKIIETKTERTLRKDTLSYRLQLVNVDYSALDAYETTIIKAFFDDLAVVGREVDLSASIGDFQKVAVSIKNAVTKQLTTAGYFPVNPASAGTGLIIVAVLLFIVVFVIGGGFGPAFIVGMVLTAITVFLCARAMPSRTAKGVAANEHILGLKLYLETAEADRIKLLQSPDAAYASPSAGPIKTVELFEKLLPFAIVLGVENAWAKQFADLYTTPPDWYGGNWQTCNAVYLANSLSGEMNTAVNQSFSAPSSSSGSGFGGGFSGGGGGGGGGGGW